MNKLIIAALILFASSVSAQEWGTPDPLFIAAGFSQKNFLSLQFNENYSSTAITNSFAKSYVLSEFIDQELKENVSQNLLKSNRFGTEASARLTYGRHPSSFFKSPDYWWSVTVADIEHIHSLFSDDLFNVYFNGNKAYAGKLADFSNFNLTFLYYQQFGFTIGHQYQGDSVFHDWSAGIFLNNGHKFFKVDAPRAKFLTSADAESIATDLDLTISGEDSLSNDNFDNNGLGGSIFLNYSFTDRNNNRFSAGLENFGWINWNDQSYYVHTDSTFNFEGIDASPLLNFTDTIETKISDDSTFVQAFLTDRTKKSQTTMLPARAYVSYSLFLKRDIFNIEIGVEQVFYAEALPKAWCTFNYFKPKHHRFGLITSFGGYTIWNAGLEYALQYASGWKFKFSVPYLSAMLNTKTGRSNSVYLSMMKYF